MVAPFGTRFWEDTSRCCLLCILLGLLYRLSQGTSRMNSYFERSQVVCSQGSDFSLPSRDQTSPTLAGNQFLLGDVKAKQTKQWATTCC